MSSLIWFQLVESSTGNPYKNTVVDAVSLPADTLVVQLRDLVKVKFNQPNYLMDIPAAILLVYKNMEAFNKRDAIEGKEVPLEADLPLKGLGISEEKALVVVVPVSTANTESYLGQKAINEGFPSSFMTMREGTVKSIFELLFPSDPEKGYFPLLFFKAPPLSGKTVMINLLVQFLQKKQIPTLHFNGLDLQDADGSVNSCIQRIRPGYSLEKFASLGVSPRVFIMDEAQCTYKDTEFWIQYVKLVLQSREFPGLRIVLFASYGSFDPYRKSNRHATSMIIPQTNIFCLDNSIETPGLYLTGEEFKEMINGTIVEKVDGLVWNLCGRHIGIAHRVIKFICQQFKNRNVEDVSQADLESVARSDGLLKFIASYWRGIPSSEAIRVSYKNLRLTMRSAKEWRIF